MNILNLRVSQLMAAAFLTDLKRVFDDAFKHSDGDMAVYKAAILRAFQIALGNSTEDMEFVEEYILDGFQAALEDPAHCFWIPVRIFFGNLDVRPATAKEFRQWHETILQGSEAEKKMLHQKGLVDYFLLQIDCFGRMSEDGQVRYLNCLQALLEYADRKLFVVTDNEIVETDNETDEPVVL